MFVARCNTGQHYLLSFVLPNCCWFLRVSWRSDFQVHRITPFLLSCHQLFRLVGPVFGEKAAWSFWLHSVSETPASSACTPQPPSSSPTAQLSSAEPVFISLEILPRMVCLLLKTLPLPQVKMGLSHTQSSHPTEYFLSTLQKTPNKNAILKEVCFFFL